MEILNITEKKLRSIIREEISDIIRKEFIKYKISQIPEITDEEQEQIDLSYGKPVYDPVESFELSDV